MRDLYLKFKDEAEAESVLNQKIVTGVDEDGNVTSFYTVPNYRNIDTIGIIYEGGQWDEEGNVITEPVALDGWHVNVRVVNEDATPLEPYQVQVNTPLRVWG